MPTPLQNINAEKIQGNLSINSVSATTYYNLPSYSFTGGTVPGATNFTNGLSATTISATTYYNLPTFTGDYLPLSGGTVYGPTIYSSGLTANTISSVNYINFITSPSVPNPTGGTVYYDSSENALSYKPLTNQNDVTVNLGQESLVRIYNNSGAQINNGQVVHITGSTSGTPTVALANASKLGTTFTDGLAQSSGVATHNIPNGEYGFITNFGIVRDLDTSMFIVGRELYLSDTIDGGITDDPDSIAFTSRISVLGWCLSSDVINGKIFVNIENENPVQSLTQQEVNVLLGNTISTGVYEFTGMTTASTTTFNIAPMRGWLVQNTYTYATKPEVQSINYTGGTNISVTNIATADSTYVLINSGLTVTQQTTFPTPQERRENIFLGKVNHPNRTSILNINNTADYDVSPMSALRDLWSPIRLINQGIIPSPNGANLSFNTSAGTLWGNGINWHNNQLSPNNVSIAAKVPASFFYRTQTGGTTGSVTVIDPRNYDVGGVITSVGTAGSNDATNQRIYLYPTGVINVLYGQTRYGTLAAAIAAIQSETFIPYPNAESTGILIGVLSVRNDIGTDGQPLTNTDYAKFTLVSKFGESFGGTGGLSTTTLQQAYDNSTTPEILINATLDGLSIQNGTGNADNTTHLIQGLNTAGNTTSFIRADGYISGTTFQTNGFIANSDGLTATTVSATTLKTSSFTANSTGLSATSVSATTYLNLPTDIRVTGGTYSSGNATFTNNTGGTFNVGGFNTGDTTLYWYAENATPPAVTPIATGTGSIALGDNAQALSDNMFVYGTDTGYQNTGSSYSILIGQRAGSGATDSAHSNFIGRSAGRGASNSSFSNFMGYFAASGATGSPHSNFIGYYAGSGATNASYNNFLGSSAGRGAFNTTYSNFQGYFAGYQANDSIYSNFIGYSAGNSASSTTGSTFIGYAAGYQNVGSNYSNFLGYNAGNSSDDTVYSNLIGFNAGTSSTGSTYSNFIGYQAGYISSGNNNSNFIGFNSGYLSTDNLYSNFIGREAGSQSSGNTYTNFFGYTAGYESSDNTYGNFIGRGAGLSATTGNNSNFIGLYAGRSSNSLTYSNAIGNNAGYEASGSTFANFIGGDAGYQSSGNTYSNFIGYQSGYKGINNSYGAFFGSGSGYQSSGNTYGVFIGTNAGLSSSGNIQSNFIGSSAGREVTGATNSNFIGTNAGQGVLGSIAANFLGYRAGYQASGTTYSNFIGYFAGILSTNSDYSNFIGTNAGNLSTGTTNSNFIGTNAGLQSNNNLSANFIGTNAGRNTSGSTYSNFIGYQAGYDSTGSSLSNLFGYNVGKTFTGNNIGTNNIIIGSNITLPNARANGINIGGVLFGMNTYGTLTGNPTTGATSTGRIGINVVTPTEALHVSGNTILDGSLNVTGSTSSELVKIIQNGSGDAFVVQDQANGDSSHFVINASGNTAIGLTQPLGSDKLTVSGNTSIYGTLYATSYQNLPISVISGSSLFSTGLSNTGLNASGVTNSNFFGVSAGRTATNANNSNFMGSSAGSSATNANNSNFFGNSAGQNATGANNSNFLGASAGDGATAAYNSNLFGYQAGKTFTGNNIGANNIIIGTNISLPNARANGINIGGVLFGSNTYSTTAGDPSTGATSTGKIGINVVTPTEALHVSGNTLINGNLTATTISATTYQNLPTDIRVTGASYSNNTFTYTNNTGGTFNTLFNTVTGLTVNGNLSVTGNTSMTGTLSVTGNTNVRAITGTSATLSGSGSSILTVIGSGTTTPIFSVQGSSGELFSVTDSLTGSLFSVNDISGLPIVEVFSDNTILMGNYLAPSLNTTAKITLTAGTNTIYSIPTSAYTGAFVDYTVISSGNTSARAGNIMTIWNTGSTQYTEVSTNDIGSTTGITFSTSLSGSNALISASATTAGWTLKTIIRAI